MTEQPLKKEFTMAYGKRFGLFACMFILCFITCSVIVGIISYISSGITTAALRIMTVLQDIVVFILPAIATAIMITRKPDSFLSINCKPKAHQIILTVLAIVASIPAMNLIVQWNESISFPESLKAIEQWMKTSEESAATSVKLLLGGTSSLDLILSIMIVGILAGLSEELFFRGMLQKLFQTRPMNIHFAIWVTAIIFSVIHLQFYGFFPRMILGAFFGYLVWWSGSLWLPVIAHALNNTLVVVSQWMLEKGILVSDLSELGTTLSITDLTLIITSVVCTTIFVYALFNRRNKI